MFAKLTPNKVVNFGDENVLHYVFFVAARRLLARRLLALDDRISIRSVRLHRLRWLV